MVAPDVVDLLELVQVQDHHRRATGPPGLQLAEHRAEPSLEEQPVGQAGQVVVENLVPQALDELTVLQGHAGVVGHGLEHAHVTRVDGAGVTHPVCHDEDPDRETLAGG
jgi:hypothetical protein